MNDILKEVEELDLKVKESKETFENTINEFNDLYNLLFGSVDKNEVISRLTKIENSNSLYRLATLYLNGIEVGQNIDLAEEYLLKISDDSPIFNINLAMIYLCDKFNKKDIKKVCKYLEMPVRTNCFLDVVLYYKLCEQINDEKYNVKFACKLLKNKLKFNAQACYYYAICMKRGIISDEKESIEELLKKAVDANVYGAAFEYVDTLKQNQNEKNSKVIIELLEKNAKENDTKSMYELASMYMKKDNFDIDKAIILYERCVENSYPLAMLELGKVYSNESYNRLDLKKARQYLEMAIKEGIVIAEIELIKLNKKGENYG